MPPLRKYILRTWILRNARLSTVIRGHRPRYVLRLNCHRASALPADYRNRVIPDAALPCLAGASEEPLRFSGFVNPVVRLGSRFFWIAFVIAEKLSPPLVLGTAFANKRVCVHHVHARKLEFVKGWFVSIAQTHLNGIPSDPPLYEKKGSYNA